ncbi:unnamed protein product [Clonostachys rosea]|uniref:Uncharacterized protein n=1 Tax=Bionectria ochroleuca TaxID=29856 RepID=A0ABY6V2F5_BIOOC|nr:unnamed protein product [Clonostachys rosea]
MLRNYTGEVTNGSWYGYQQSINSNHLPRWSIALNRFISKDWLAFKDSSFNAFENETEIEAGLTKLLFQFDFPRRNGLYSGSRNRLVMRNCNVVAQRPSLKPHPPENLSFLSDPQIFEAISRLLPFVSHGEKETLNYIFNVASLPMIDLIIDDMIESNIDFPISATKLSTRLSQAINTFYLVHQTSSFMDPSEVPSYEKDVPFLAPAWTVGKATTINAYYVYLIKWPWMVVSMASCLILTLASIVGVGFVHSGHGPEVLGYVSTAIRDSDISGLPAQAARMDGDELSKAMRKRRFRYGRKLGEKGPHTVGFGPEEDIIIL